MDAHQVRYRNSGAAVRRKELADYIMDCNRKGAPVTLNVGVYLDGAASPATLRQLDAVRKSIRGK